jgi:hydrogenase maturation protease
LIQVFVSTIVLGLGNPTWGDDSAGPRVARALGEKLSHPEVTVAEASIAGLDILELLADYDKAIIVDAIETRNGTPGTIYRLETHDIAVGVGAFPHGVDFIAALELGRRLGLSLPASVTVFAIEAGQTAFPQEECTPPVREAVPRCADMIIRELQTTNARGPLPLAVDDKPGWGGPACRSTEY